MVSGTLFDVGDDIGRLVDTHRSYHWQPCYRKVGVGTVGRGNIGSDGVTSYDQSSVVGCVAVGYCCLGESKNDCRYLEE